MPPTSQIHHRARKNERVPPKSQIHQKARKNGSPWQLSVSILSHLLERANISLPGLPGVAFSASPEARFNTWRA